MNSENRGIHKCRKKRTNLVHLGATSEMSFSMMYQFKAMMAGCPPRESICIALLTL